jgi:hypothetical protein
MNDIEKLAHDVLEADKKVTPGPWKAGLNVLTEASIVAAKLGDANYIVNGGVTTWSNEQKNNYSFIALTRTAAPKLATSFLQLREENKRLREALLNLVDVVTDYRESGSIIDGPLFQPEGREQIVSRIEIEEERARAALEGKDE